MAKYQIKADTIGCVGYVLQYDDHNKSVKNYGTFLIINNYVHITKTLMYTYSP